jgi:hypothetical protein
MKRSAEPKIVLFFPEQAYRGRNALAHCRAAVPRSFPGLLCRSVSVLAGGFVVAAELAGTDVNTNRAAVQNFGLSLASFPMAVIHDTRQGKYYKMAALDTPATVASLQSFLDAYEKGDLPSHKTRALDEL